ncbi:MAG: aminotransferase class V-fold PLP-dependent enzyme [Planctomycetota bacterium]|nr:aminotransferase class V-fold PLP-dependent enzyme [Planctomycetota bacterium]
MNDDLLRWREEFPILERTVYLNSNSLGPMPRGVRDQLGAFMDQWDQRGVRAWLDDDGWWDMPVTVGDLLCDILNAPHGTISMHQNVSVAESVILSCLTFDAPRNKIVYTDMNFPSVMYIMEEQRRRGARVVEVPGSDDGVSVDLDRLLEAIDEETLIVPVSHVLFRSSYIQDAAAIVKRAHEVGAMVILDIYQSAGCVPVDLQALDVDMAVGGSVKWLCGGPGAGYLYVRPDVAEQLKPTYTGWQAHARPFDFERGATKWGELAYRFLNGTPHVPALFAAKTGYEMIREIGVDRIRARSLHLTQTLLDAAAAADIPVTCPEDQEHRGGTVALNSPDGKAVCDELNRRDFVCDYRPEAGIRLGPHFFVTEDECRSVVDEIVKILKQRGLR